MIGFAINVCYFNFKPTVAATCLIYLPLHVLVGRKDIPSGQEMQRHVYV